MSYELKTLGVKSGPYTSAQLRDMARNGELLPESLIKKSGTEKWIEASRVKGLDFGSIKQSTAVPAIPVAKVVKDVAVEIPVAVPVRKSSEGNKAETESLAARRQAEILQETKNLNKNIIGIFVLVVIAIFVWMVLGEAGRQQIMEELRNIGF